MAQYISVPTQWGNLTFDLDRPRVFKDRVFRTESEAHAELATLDERCYPLLRRTDAGEWVILVHSQERRDERGV